MNKKILAIQEGILEIPEGILEIPEDIESTADSTDSTDSMDLILWESNEIGRIDEDLVVEAFRREILYEAFFNGMK